MHNTLLPHTDAHDLRVWRFRENPDKPGTMESALFHGAALPETGWVDTPAKLKLTSDSRCWMYRKIPGRPDAYEGEFFQTPEQAPAEEGWTGSLANLNFPGVTSSSITMWRRNPAYRDSPGHPDAIESCTFTSPAAVPEGQGWLDSPDTLKPKLDTRVWMYRLDNEGKVKGLIFDSPEAVPEGKGWETNPGKLKPKQDGGQPAIGTVAATGEQQPDPIYNTESLAGLEFPRWLYRHKPANPKSMRGTIFESADHPDGMEGHVFASLSQVPEGEGWVSTPAKLKPKQKDEYEHAVRTEETASEPRRTGCEELRQTGQSGGAGGSGSAVGETQGRPEAAAGPGRYCSGENELRTEVRGKKPPVNGEAPPEDGREKALNFDGLTIKALCEIAEKAGVYVNKHWGRARIEQTLRDAK
jgi:hypothetical protein